MDLGSGKVANFHSLKSLSSECPTQLLPTTGYVHLWYTYPRCIFTPNLARIFRYSDRKLSTGLANPAFMVLKLTVKRAINNVPNPASTNTHHCTSILYAKP